MKPHILRMIGFGLVPSLSLLASLVILPLISERYGGPGWTALTIGQSVGAFASVVVGLAWPVIGGHAIAGASTLAERRHTYWLSILSRLLTFIVILPVSTLIVYLISSEFIVEAIIFNIATTMNGFSAAWYFAGVGDPRPLVINEALVRVLFHGVTIVGMFGGLGLWWYALCNLATGPVMFMLNWFSVMKGSKPARLGLREITKQTKNYSAGTLSRLSISGFTFGGPIVMALVNPGALALYTACDQLQKTGTSAAAAVTNTFVSWVGKDQQTATKRSRLSLMICSLGATAFLLIWLFAGPRVMELVFAGQIQLNPLTNFLLGISISAIFMLRSVELLQQIPRGRASLVFTAGLWSSLIGVGLLVVFGSIWGANGALFTSLVVVLVALAIYWLAPSRRGPAESSQRTIECPKKQLEN